MSSMADNYQKRADDRKGLDGQLAAAQAQVVLKQRDVTIAQYNQQIAQADLDYAGMLQSFQNRFLNADFWRRMAQFANQLMRRYVDLEARTAWQAERALAFEQDRKIKIIRMNYLPGQTLGVAGADNLQADLAELEANRIQGMRLTTPVKHTISLAREFPIAFGQLKQTGSCRLHTQEGSLRAAYPGTYAYRIRAVTGGGVYAGRPSAARHSSQPGCVAGGARGRCRLGHAGALPGCAGAIGVPPARRSVRVRIAGRDADAVRRQRLRNRLGADVSAAGQSHGPALADVLITFDMNAGYSQALAVKMAADLPLPLSRSILMAASVLDARGLESLRSAPPAPVHITFDPRRLSLPAQEKGRKVAQIAVLCVGATASAYKASLTATKTGATVSFTMDNGIALSNDGPLLGSKPKLPLNALVGQDVAQPFVLEIDKAGVADELARLYDVVLYLEYTATM
jgi:hypothetical protein